MKDRRLPRWPCKRAKDFHRTFCHSPSRCSLGGSSDCAAPPMSSALCVSLHGSHGSGHCQDHLFGFQKDFNGDWKSLKKHQKMKMDGFAVTPSKWQPMVIGKLPGSPTRLSGRWCVHPPMVDELLVHSARHSSRQFSGFISFQMVDLCASCQHHRYVTLCTKHQSTCLSFFKWTIQRIISPYQPAHPTRSKREPSVQPPAPPRLCPTRRVSC